MEKATVKFISDDDKEITIPVTVTDNGTLELSVDFGEDGENIHQNQLHHGLAVTFFNTLATGGAEQDEQDG